MKKSLVVVFSFLFILLFISASCEEGQIDINSASLSELDELYGIGPAKAQAIIDARPYESIEGLIQANGIGDATLTSIKSQGLACMDEENEKEVEENKNESAFEEKLEKPEEKDNEENNIAEKNIEINTIKLNTKDIKSEENKEEIEKNDYAKYGLIVFCALLGVLFILNKRKYKTEFDEK